MKNKRNVSRLSDHILKKGILATPLNHGLGDKLQTNSWIEKRMPEYLWIGLILQSHNRTEGLEVAGKILEEISNQVPILPSPKVSDILGLSADEQQKVYDIICKFVDKKILAPLTVLYRIKDHPVLNKHLYIPQISIDDRISILLKTIRNYGSCESFETTDLRFIVVFWAIIKQRLNMPPSESVVFDEYPYTEHSNEKMRLYRSSIRSIEMAFCQQEEPQSTKKFWRDIGMLTGCEPFIINFDENEVDYDDFITTCRKSLNYIFAANKEESLLEDKFDVLTGSVNYALKIFVEIHDKSLTNSILGRHGVRTIIETIIILKYLLKHEKDKPNIWEEYKLYGISHYKLVLLKARESDFDKKSHFVPPVVECLVNEIKFEEFIDVDFKYFDKQSIREKSIDVGEKELFDLYYDYDSSYAHGLWGAVRESAMLGCNNPSHLNHNIPDIFSKQNLPDVKEDCVKFIKRLFLILAENFEIPEEFLTIFKE